MKTKTIMKLVASFAALALTACSGGGGGPTETLHERMAREFVNRVNVDVYGYNLTLVKTNTERLDYIVVYDNKFGTYDAYWIGGYSVGQNLSDYLAYYQYTFYYDLDYIGNNRYRDYDSGNIFEKTSADTKNLAKMQALREEIAISKKAEELRATYGLSEEKSVNTARFAYKIKTSPAGTYNAKDFDAFAKDLTGTSITEFQNVVASGDKVALNEKLEKAGQVTGMGTEGVNKLINEMFLGQSAQ